MLQKFSCTLVSLYLQFVFRGTAPFKQRMGVHDVCHVLWQQCKQSMCIKLFVVVVQCTCDCCSDAMPWESVFFCVLFTTASITLSMVQANSLYVGLFVHRDDLIWGPLLSFSLVLWYCVQVCSLSELWNELFFSCHVLSKLYVYNVTYLIV